MTACSSTSGHDVGSHATRVDSPATAPSATAPSATGSTPSTPSPSSTASSPSSAAPAAAAVHITLLNSDGATYGVGMPVIALLSRRITSAKALQAATSATVDGSAIKVAWYVQNSNYRAGYPLEAHLRPEGYWPAHSHVHVDIAAEGVTAGPGLVFDDSLTSDWHTGARHIATVSDRDHTMTITSDGTPYGTFPVSLGEPKDGTRTYSGTKVIMEQTPTTCMRDTADTYHECGVKWDQRVTYTGEYLHAAPWNCTGHPGCTGPYNNIGSADSSTGCTNLRPSDAERLYHFLRVGDVVRYPDADGPQMPMGLGYGDWNVSWSTWLTGGVVPST